MKGRIAIREVTEEEALRYGRFGGSAAPRFLIVDADEPDKTLHYGGNLGRAEGSDWIVHCISEGRRWEAHRGYVLVLTAEQKLLEKVGNIVDLNDGFFPPSKIAEDPAVAVAKYDRIARTVHPQAFWDPFTNDRELVNGHKRKIYD